MSQGLAEYFSVCGAVTAVRLAGSKGSKKAWIEFGTKESAKSAREYDNTVRILILPAKSSWDCIDASPLQVRLSQGMLYCAPTLVVVFMRICTLTHDPSRYLIFFFMQSVLLVLQVLGAATVRVRPSKTAIHTNGLQREQDSNSGSKTPSPSRTGDTNSPGGSHSQLLATSRQVDRHSEVAQQPAQLRNHSQAAMSGSPPLNQPGQATQQQAMHMGPSSADIQQHLMANMSSGMLHQQPQQYAMNGSGYAGVAGSMPMLHAQQPLHTLQQQSAYQQLPARSSGTASRGSNQNYAPAMSPNNSGRTSPGLKRAYDDVQQSNAGAAAAAAAFLSKQQQQQQQQADDKRMRMSH